MLSNELQGETDWAIHPVVLKTESQIAAVSELDVDVQSRQLPLVEL